MDEIKREASLPLRFTNPSSLADLGLFVVYSGGVITILYEKEGG